MMTAVQSVLLTELPFNGSNRNINLEFRGLKGHID